MNSNHDQPATPQLEHELPEVIYGYPASTTNDEIDFGELINKLIGQSKLMFYIVLVGAFLSIAVALLLPNIYRQEIILSTPNKTDIVELNTNGYEQHTPVSIFKEYYEYLRSAEELKFFISSNDYLTRLYPNNTKGSNALIAEFEKTFSIFILEPEPEVKGGQVKLPERISMQAEGEQEAAIVDVLNHYIRHIGTKLIQNLVEEQRVQITSELKVIERKIIYSRNNAELNRLNEIARLENKNREKITELNNQIDALVLKSKDDKKSELLELEEALKIASEMNISRPTMLSDLSRLDRDGASNTEITISDEKDYPLYLMGTIFIRAKIDELESRKDDLAFIEEYRNLKRSKHLAENDAELKALKMRVNDDPYIKELPELIQRKEILEGLSLNFDNTKVVRVERYANVTGKKIKPKRSLIVAGGVIISSVIALFIGLIIISIRRHN